MLWSFGDNVIKINPKIEISIKENKIVLVAKI